MVAVTRPGVGQDPWSAALSARVMVLEDDPDIAELLSVCLSASGCDVVVTRARSVSEVVAAVREHRPRGLVVELPRPGSAHEDRFDRLRDHPAMVAVPLIATTSYPPAHRDVVLRASDALLAKPFSVTDLMERLSAGMAATTAPVGALLCSDPWLDQRNAAADG